MSRVTSSNRYYLSIDVDVLDPAYVPDVSYPEPEGLTPTQLIEILTEVLTHPPLVIDIMELAPRSWPTTSAYVVAKVVYEIIAAIHRTNSLGHNFKPSQGS